MHRLPPETSDDSRINEATPLLQDDACAIDADLYAIGGAVGGSTTAIGGSTFTIGGAVGDLSTDIGGSTAIGCLTEMDCSTMEIDGTSGCDEEFAQEEMDNIVRTLFSAWLKFPPRTADEPKSKDREFFDPRAIQAMSTAWRQIKAERDVLPESEAIVQGLAAYAVDYIVPAHLMTPGKEDVEKALFIPVVTKLVENGWQKILKGIEEEDARVERIRKRRESGRRIRERLRRQQEIAEVLRFYAPFARINNSPPLDCRTFCLFLCQCCSIFIFQVPIHTLLLCWPISIAVMGGMFMTQCPMSHLMPIVMMALGSVGAVAILLRLSFVIYETLSQNKISSTWPWIVLKVVEFTFLDCLLIQLFYFYTETPNFHPGSPKYCNKTFYDYVHWVNYVSIAMVSAWIFVYFTKGLLWLRSRKFDYGFR